MNTSATRGLPSMPYWRVSSGIVESSRMSGIWCAGTKEKISRPVPKS
ncbi:MAG: hypothetical protein H6Q02_1805 [Acidobacteria bacterium]|nr:hypothetical protein [Acidobacteriota bacterium]